MTQALPVVQDVIVAPLPNVDARPVRAAVGSVGRAMSGLFSSFSVAMESDRERVIRVALATPIPGELSGHRLVFPDDGVGVEFEGEATMEALLASAGFGREVAVASGVYVLAGVIDAGIPGYSPASSR